MHSFLIDMCRSCLATNIDLKEFMIVKDRKVRCFDAVKIIISNAVMPARFEYGYSLCEVCINLLKSAAIFQRRLFESHNAYSKYMETLNFSNDYKLSVSIFQPINKEDLSMEKTDKGSCRVKQSTHNQIPTDDTYFQDILNDEDLNFDTYLLEDFDNFSGELDTKVDVKENILLTTLQEECKKMDNVITDSINIYDKKVIISDNHNDLYLNNTENTLQVTNIKQEHENVINVGINKISTDIEHIIPWESTKKEHESIELVYVSKKQCKNDILGTNLPAIDFMQEESIKSEACKRTQTDTKERPYKCDDCEKSFYRKHVLINHKRIHTREQPYNCDVCNARFSKFSNLNVHKLIHTGERPFKCDACEKSFSHKKVLINHKRIHTRERPFNCDVCKARFCHTSNLIIDKRIYTGERPYNCDVCNARFSNLSNLNVHKRIHTGERPFKCDACEKSFSQKQVLINHKRIHTRERPYNCDVCKARFSQASTLIIHKRIHTGERPYNCDVCNARFSNLSNLNVHKRIHTGERPFKCDACEKSFSQKQVLINHKRIHRRERPYNCDVCKARFSQASTLIIHKRIHTGERPYNCDVCEKSFSNKANLTRHKCIHTRERPYQCNNVNE